MIDSPKIIIKYGLEAGRKLGQEVAKESTAPSVPSVSCIADECLANVNRGILGLQKRLPKLDKGSRECHYFGVDSAENIENCLGNQIALTWLKVDEQKLENFPPVILSKTFDIPHYSAPVDSNSLPMRIAESMYNLKEKGVGRLTITDKLFGKNGMDGTHTIGLVYHNGKYVFLDSIPQTYPEIKNYRERLVKFLGLNPKDVVFSNKPQQTMEEYTCNNWTLANIDAVLDFWKAGGKDKDLTPQVLDEILPENINEVLSQQYEYTTTKLSIKPLNDRISEYYGF